MAKQPADSKEVRAKRLTQLRKLTGLTRRAFAQKYGLSENTVKNWEYAHLAGLSEHGARLMIDAFIKEGIECSINWLLYGKGNPPKRKSADPTLQATIKESPDHAHQTILKEINDFKKHHAEAVIYEVKDDSMLPFYRNGDFVAGVRHYAKDISQLIDRDCIVETKSGETLLRTLMISNMPRSYNLYATNQHTRLQRPYLYDVEIVTAAPVIWIRRGKKW